jgi:hypothetical protein
MGVILSDIYKLVEYHGGLKGRMRFAIKTKVSSSKAAAVEDRPEYIQSFIKIANLILQKDIGAELKQKYPTLTIGQMGNTQPPPNTQQTTTTYTPKVTQPEYKPQSDLYGQNNLKPYQPDTKLSEEERHEG